MKKIQNTVDKLDKTTLKQSFMEACSDKDFKEFVRSLGAKDEILMNYTSTLEDAFIEHKNCSNCKGFSSCKNKIKGYKYTPNIKNNIITFDYEACDRKIKIDEKEAYQKNVYLYEMPEEIRTASFKDIYKDDKKRLPILKYFKEFMNSYNNMDKPRGMYLYGSFGSGKTYLIAALFNEMAKKGINSVLIYYPEFLRSLKASFNTDYSERFNYIKKAPLLLLDDIGAENASAWSRDEVLGPILQYRMEEKLPTFFTSNLTLEELEKALSVTTSSLDKLKARRIIERIKQLTVKEELISKNRRG